LFYLRRMVALPRSSPRLRDSIADPGTPAAARRGHRASGALVCRQSREVLAHALATLEQAQARLRNTAELLRDASVRTARSALTSRKSTTIPREFPVGPCDARDQTSWFVAPTKRDSSA
jgi:hypothetical protein